MSHARGYPNAGHFYSNLVGPVKIDMQFTVDDSNGLGITSLKSNGYVRNVFMHTTTTPSANDGYTNPNPAAGYALVQLKYNFNKYIGEVWSCQSPNSGSSILVTTGVTAGLAYTITIVGTTTTAGWQALGVPQGVTPAVGVSFIAPTTTTTTGTGAIQVPLATGSKITTIDVIGNPNQSISNSAISPNGGAWLLVRFLAATAAGTTTLVATAPSAGSIFSLSALFDNSSVTVDGL